MNNSQIETINKAQESFYNGDLRKTARRLKRLPRRLRGSWVDSTLSNSEAQCPEKRGNFYRLLTNDCCETRHGTLDPDVLEYCCPLDNGRHDSPAKSSAISRSLGALDVLPLEILQGILIEELDLATLTHLRSISRSFRCSVDSLPQYRAIFINAPNSVRAALSLEVASVCSCKKLYDTLCTDKCSVCGKFGAFLYLPSCERTCFQCFTTETRFLPMTREHSKFYWPITSKDLETAHVPIARSVSGRYENVIPKLQRARLPLVDYLAAGRAALSVHGTVENINAAREENTERKWANWEQKALALRAIPENQGLLPPLPPFLSLGDGQRAHSNRWMCIIPFPWLDRSRGVVEWGVACNGCKIRCYDSVRAMSRDEFKKAFAAQRSLYSQKGFLAHLFSCAGAQKIFREGYATKIAGGTHLYAYDHPVCEIAGDISNREFYPDPYKERLTPVERGKRSWEKLKPVRRQKRSTAGRASTAGDT